MSSMSSFENVRLKDRLEKDIERIISRVKELDGIEGIILTGSYGRDEGSYSVKGGRVQPLNDYDLILVTKNGDSIVEQLREISDDLAQELGIDFVDLAPMHPDYFASVPLTIYYYELKHGSRVLEGDKSILDRMPCFRPENIPLWEGVRLLFNRMAGLLGGFLQERRRSLSEQEYLYMRNQLVKAGVACGDALVLSYGKYHHLYRHRRQVFGQLVEEGTLEFLPKEGQRLLDESYDHKLKPVANYDRDLWQWLAELLPHYRSIFLHLLGAYTNTHSEQLWQAVEAFLLFQPIPSEDSIRTKMKRWGRALTQGKPSYLIDTAPKDRAYAALPLVLLNCPVFRFEPTETNKAQDILRSLSFPISPAQRDDRWSLWEALRRGSFDAWDSLCH